MIALLIALKVDQILGLVWRETAAERPGEWLKQRKRIRSIAGHNFQISAELQKLNAVSAQFPTINFSGPGFR
ncbi:MAG TPA: hypothetical protein ENJ12_01820 [Thiolapillus brandeum]|uniref:Uncharacterized protein n=1 Tax=Thiolapillus brandeum TaxID=1076588 RepID=A0A831RUV0_9GAMM|nr:hypothetical protein [Thiolapillus brandeum]